MRLERERVKAERTRMELEQERHRQERELALQERERLERQQREARQQTQSYRHADYLLISYYRFSKNICQHNPVETQSVVCEFSLFALMLLGVGLLFYT